MCDVVDAGTQWQFVDGQPFPDFEPFCASKCVDFPGTLTLVGQRDLRKVPLLPKLRKVDRLIINVAGLPDLRGLEKVDVGSLLNLVNNRGDSPDQTFASTIGLEDDAIEVVGISDTPGLTTLQTRLRRVTSLTVENTGVRDLDTSSFALSYLRLISNNELRSLELGSGTMESIWIEANPALELLTWGELRARSIWIWRNPRLSSCQVSKFVQDAGAVRTTVLDNGPCP